MKQNRTPRLDRRNHVIVAPPERPIEKVTRFVECGGLYDPLRGPLRTIPLSLPRIKWAEGERA